MKNNITNPMIEKKQFYTFKPFNGFNIFKATLAEYGNYCFVSGDLSGYNLPIPHLSFPNGYYTNKKFADFINADCLDSEIICSDRVIELLLDNNIKGWKTYPVEIYDMKENYVGGYNGFSVIGRCGAIKPSLSEVFVDYNEKALLGFPLDLDTWDGSDIFILEHTVYKYASQKAKKVLELLEEDCLWFVDIAKRPIIKKDAIWKAPMGVVINE